MRGEKLKNHIIVQFDKSISLAWRCCQIPPTLKKNMKRRGAYVVGEMHRSDEVWHLCNDQQHDLGDARGVPSDTFDGGCEYAEPRSTSRMISGDHSYHRIGPLTLGTNGRARPLMLKAISHTDGEISNVEGKSYSTVGDHTFTLELLGDIRNPPQLVQSHVKIAHLRWTKVPQCTEAIPSSRA
jgi:hypothetical protein